MSVHFWRGMARGDALQAGASLALGLMAILSFVISFRFRKDDPVETPKPEGP